MRFKLDENLDPGLADLFDRGGHDVESVRAEGLSGASDDAVFQACRAEQRALVTLDLDFSNPLRFPPGASAGVIIVRAPRPSLAMIRATLSSVLPELLAQPLSGKLWIAEPGRIRVYDPSEA